MHMDSAGMAGFVFKKGKITAIAKDSSAARNGLLIDHQLTEVGGQNVVGLQVRCARSTHCRLNVRCMRCDCDEAQ